MTDEAVSRDIDILTRFLTENPQLEELSAKSDSFNLMNVLRVGHYEVRHSNILAWLLDPKESHGLGDDFFSQFLSLLLKSHQSINWGFNILDLHLHQTEVSRVSREEAGIDILIEGITKSIKWCIAIENKVRSSESKGQLNKYHHYAKTSYPEHNLAFIYLTLDGHEPSEEGVQLGYLPVSWVNIHEVLDKIFSKKKRSLSNDVEVFLRHYIENLKGIVMADKRVEELCKEIYRKHRRAIDLIIQHGTNTNVICETTPIIKDLVDLDFIVEMGSSIWFMPKELARSIPNFEAPKQFVSHKVPMTCVLSYERRAEKLRLFFQVNYMPMNGNKIDLFDYLKKKNLCHLSAGEVTKRILSFSEDLLEEDVGNSDAIRKVCEPIIKEFNEKCLELAQAFKAYDWPKDDAA